MNLQAEMQHLRDMVMWLLQDKRITVGREKLSEALLLITEWQLCGDLDISEFLKVYNEVDRLCNEVEAARMDANVEYAHLAWLAQWIRSAA